MQKLKNKYEGKFYIVRCNRAGVFAGEIEERNRTRSNIKKL